MSRENKSRLQIVQSFIRLMQDHGYNDISISDITRDAHISRITFYRNFNSKENVMMAFIDGVVAEIQEAVAANRQDTTLEGYFRLMFSIIQPYHMVVKALYLANKGDLILSCFDRHLFKTPMELHHLSMDFYETRFFSGAFYNVLIAWILRDSLEPCEEMARLCSSLITKKEFLS